MVYSLAINQKDVARVCFAFATTAATSLTAQFGYATSIKQIKFDQWQLFDGKRVGDNIYKVDILFTKNGEVLVRYNGKLDGGRLLGYNKL